VALIAIPAALMGGSGDGAPGRADAFDPRQAASAALHHFTPSYVGDVWIRITPSRSHAGESASARAALGAAAPGRVAGQDRRVAGRVLRQEQPGRRHDPRERRTRGADRVRRGDPPAGALDIKAGWKPGG
jgi:hypothetical protein